MDNIVIIDAKGVECGGPEFEAGYSKLRAYMQATTPPDSEKTWSRNLLDAQRMAASQTENTDVYVVACKDGPTLAFVRKERIESIDRKAIISAAAKWTA